MSAPIGQAAFLRGGISAQYLSSAAAVPFVARRSAVPALSNTQGYDCSVNPHIPACNPNTRQCPGDPTATHNSFCPTREFVCGTTAKNC